MSRNVQGIRLPPEVQAAIRAMHPDLKRRIRTALDAIQRTPAAGKLLKRELEGWRSLRVGRIRVVYREVRGVIEIGAIGPRSSIYLDAARRLSRPQS